MKVLILSSSRDQIDDEYKILARNLSQYLAQNECDLIFGGSSSSMMGICYQEFKKYNRKIYAYTNKKYIDDLKNISYAKSIICDTTFDLKKQMFENSDLIICLPGGVGTISELLSYIEEKRSNDKDNKIIIYDDKYYNKLFSLLDETIFKGFSDKDIYNKFIIVKNQIEFEKLFIEMDSVKSFMEN